MKEIDEYLKQLYKHLNASDREIADFKEEMRNHLLDSIHELEAEGKSPQESVRIAIERFGDLGLIKQELPKVLMVSRRRFSKLILAASCAVLVICTVILITSIDNLNKQKELHMAELTRQTIIQELQQSQKTIMNYNRIFSQANKLAVVYNSNSGQLSKFMNAKYNITIIDDIAQMSKSFKYHNAVLMAVAIIAADTDYECSYYRDIAELGVMKLSDSTAVIELALKAHEAKTINDKASIQDKLEQLKKTADFTTYQQAMDYNNKLSEH